MVLCFGTDEDMKSPEFRELRDDLVREDVPPADIPLRSDGVSNESLDELFTWKEFDLVMVACRARSYSPYSPVCFGLYCFFISPSPWRETYVIFIPKPDGKGYRPIWLILSMSKLFERMVCRRLEHQAEHNNWIPNYQFGFRRGRSAIDAVTIVSADILQGSGSLRGHWGGFQLGVVGGSL